jgi:glycerol-1-phosphatase
MDGGTVTAASAFEAYLAIRDRLPPAPQGGGYRRAETLGEIAAPYDVVLLDAYGVLNVGNRAVPGAVERVADLRRTGKRVVVVSNSAGYPRRVMMARYASLGFDFAPGEVVSSRQALIAHLSGEVGRRWGAMLSPAHGTEDFGGIDLSLLGDDAAEYDRAEGFLLVGSDGWTEARQALIEASLHARRRPVLVGNPDLVAPREDGLSLEPGHYAHRLADRTGATPRFFGKPFRGIYELALSRLSPMPAPDRVLMVGDTLHTDVLGGRSMGFATALMTDFGAFSGADVDAAIAASGIAPDYVVRRP